MKKIASITTILTLITFMFVLSAHAYDAWSDCVRKITMEQNPDGSWYAWARNTAEAKANNNGLENGTINVYAYAGGVAKSIAMAFSTKGVRLSASDWAPGVAAVSLTHMSMDTIPPAFIARITTPIKTKGTVGSGWLRQLTIRRTAGGDRVTEWDQGSEKRPL